MSGPAPCRATSTPEGQALLYRAERARAAVRKGADPALMLSYVVWPTVRIERATQEARAA